MCVTEGSYSGQMAGGSMEHSSRAVRMAMVSYHCVCVCYRGELQWSDGRRFHGAFQHGCQDGYGVLSLCVCVCYRGELQWSDGKRFHGAFQHGCQDGYGVYTVNGEEGEKEIYDGIWRQGKLCGYGYVK